MAEGRSGRHFGAVPGVPEGALFPSRRELSAARVHLPLRAGISGSATEGADSIVLSGGYEDDRDEGGVILYTGEGGRDPESGEQVKPQRLVRGNLALAVSAQHALPVRVTRGSGGRSPYAPAEGYEYGGLYVVERYWPETGRSGFQIWRYRLVKLGHAASASFS